MGKTSKLRKKRRLESGFSTATNGNNNNHSNTSGNLSSNQGSTQDAEEDIALSSEAVMSACATLRALSASPESLRHPSMRPLRSLLIHVSSMVTASRQNPSKNTHHGTTTTNNNNSLSITNSNNSNTTTNNSSSSSNSAIFNNSSNNSSNNNGNGSGVNGGGGVGLVAAVSDALREGRTLDALEALEAMHRLGIKPKLGSMCRWVRDADAVRAARSSCSAGDDKESSGEKGGGEKGAGGGGSAALVVEPDPQIIAVLDMVMRVSDPGSYPYVPRGGTIDTSSEPWACVPLRAPESADRRAGDGDGAEAEAWRSKFTVIHTIKGSERIPSNHHDLVIHYSSPNATRLEDSEAARSRVRKVDVPGIPLAFTLLDVLSVDECARIVAAAESVGYAPDAPMTTASNNSVLAHNFVWMLDPETERIVFERVQRHLPAEIRGHAVAGINRRWRLYRYADPGQVYRPHIDGGWTASGTTKEAFPEPGEYLPNDGSGRSSRLTFLIYLNEGFEGGETSYFLPSPGAPGTLEARRVAPRIGSVMCFAHSCTEGNLLHEGSAVLKGCKYIARTEVLYQGFEQV